MASLRSLSNACVELFDERNPRLVDVMNSESANAVFIEELHNAPICEAWDGPLGDRL